MENNWHVLRTRYGAELDVARALADRWETLCPKRAVVRFTGRHRVLAEVAVYASYVFVRAPLADPVTWHDVREISGVVEIMGGEYPWPVSDEAIEDLRERTDTDGYLADAAVKALLARWKRGFDVGDQVRIRRGKWRGFSGVVTELTGEILTAVKTALFGREITLYVLVDNCEVVEDVGTAGSDPALSQRGWSQRPNRRKQRRLEYQAAF